MTASNQGSPSRVEPGVFISGPGSTGEVAEENGYGGAADPLNTGPERGLKVLMHMKVYTVDKGNVKVGALVGTMTLTKKNVSFPAIIVGEEGRGRERGVIPVHHRLVRPVVEGDPWVAEKWAACPGQELVEETTLATTKAGNPRFAPNGDEEDGVIVVFRTSIGFRGSNLHSGDRDGWRCEKCGEGDASSPMVPMPADRKVCPVCGAESWREIINPAYRPFPGRVLAKGRIAQGMAGRAGSGEQLVAIIPWDTVVYTVMSGRLYGAPGDWFYRFPRGGEPEALSWEERRVADLW